MPEIPKGSEFGGDQKPYDAIDSIWAGGFEDARRLQAKNGFVICATDIGIRREKNEDRLVVNTEQDSFAVVDGMGGMEHGEEAAQILAEELQWVEGIFQLCRLWRRK